MAHGTEVPVRQSLVFHKVRKGLSTHDALSDDAPERSLADSFP